MRLRNVSVRNYKGFRDTGEIPLSSGINFVVGANNSGKTAFLEAVSLRFTDNPHKTLTTIPRVGISPDSISRVTINFCCSRQELRDLVVQPEQSFRLPIPEYNSHSNLYRGDRNNNQPDPDAIWKFFAGHEDFQSVVTFENGSAVSIQDPTHGHFKAVGDSTRRASFTYRVQNDGAIESQGGGETGHRDGNWLGVKLGNILQSRLYLFKAERFNLARSTADASRVLKPDASNLATVILNLQKNESRKQRLNSLLKRVLPSIYGVSASISSTHTGQAELVVWTHDPSSEREDLAYPLDQCGTGVSQIVAMLTVLVTSDFPTCLIIDEPNSFLHPGAVRNLLEIFEEYNQHQYVISSHSPTALTSVLSANILLTETQDSVSGVACISHEEVEDQKKLLLSVGARLSDVFGADQILWVEGKTEELCFPRLIREAFPSKKGLIAVLSVPDTGAFDDTRQVDRTINIYKKLASGVGLVPKALAFVFDRENRKRAWIEKLQDTHSKSVVFLERRTLENYLIHPKAISALLVHLTGDDTDRTEAISIWLAENKRKTEYGCSESVYDDENLLVIDIDAPRLLDHCLSSLTNNSFSFDSNKAEYSSLIFNWLMSNEYEHLSGLVETFKKLPLLGDDIREK
jgi:hypothetical protein